MPDDPSCTTTGGKSFFARNPNSYFKECHIAPTDQLLILCGDYLGSGIENNTELLKILWCYLVSLDWKLQKELRVKKPLQATEKSALRKSTLNLLAMLEVKLKVVGESDRVVYMAWINGLFRAQDKDARKEMLVDPLGFPEFAHREWLCENVRL